MPTTPSQRSTRSNSNTQTINLHDIKTLIESTKTEIVTSISCEIAKLNETIGSLMKRIEVIEDKQSELARRCQKLEEKSNIERLETEEILREVENRYARKKFIIVTGLPECHTGTPVERKLQDKDTLMQLMTEIGVDVNEPQHIERIGRPNQEKPRLIRFKCRDTTERMTILRHSKNLRSSTSFRNVFINPDLTYSQRERNKELRKELRCRREAGETVHIRRGMIVGTDPQQNFH